MQIVAPGTSFSTTIDLVMVDGTAAAPDSVTCVIYDVSDSVVPGTVDVTFTPGQSQVTLTIHADCTQLADGVVTEARAIEIDMVKNTEQSVFRTYFLIAKTERLEVMTNSFGTYAQLLSNAAMLQNLPGWSAASDTDRQIAAVAAFQKLVLYSYDFGWLFGERMVATSFMINEFYNRISPIDWQYITPVFFASLPPDFKRAMYDAQVVEADAILNPSIDASKRAAGIITEKVGESTTTYASTKKAVRDISDRTFQVLRRYITTTRTVRR